MNIICWAEVTLDTGRGQSITPTITISDVDKARADGREGNDPVSPQSATDGGQLIPGAISDHLAAHIPDWY